MLLFLILFSFITQDGLMVSALKMQLIKITYGLLVTAEEQKVFTDHLQRIRKMQLILNPVLLLLYLFIVILQAVT